MKPQAHIEDWIVLGDLLSGACLVGRVSSHERQSEFKAEYQRTSLLVYFDESKGIAETLNTRYTLGKRHSG